MPDQNPEAYTELFKLLSQRQPLAAQPQTAEEQELNMPPIPVSPFAPDPPMYGGPPEVAKLFQKLLQRAPNLKKIVTSVTVGPSEDYTGRMNINEAKGGKNFPAHEFDKINLLGLTNLNTGKVTLNPRLSKDPAQMSEILVHELAHAGSRSQDEKTAQQAEDLFNQVQSRMTRTERDKLASEKSATAMSKLFEELKKLGAEVRIE